jgi:hypothetical protein
MKKALLVGEESGETGQKSACGKLEILLAFATDCGQTTAHPETIRTDARRAYQT